MTDDTLSQQKLESYLWGCAEYLRNKIDAGDYKVYIFPMLFYKRVSDVYDEEYESLLAETNDKKYEALYRKTFELELKMDEMMKMVQEIHKKITKRS